MTDKLVCGVSTFGDTFDSVNGLIGTNATAAGLVLGKLVNNIDDVNILVNSDSTGTANNEWVYLYAQWLADNYNEFSVNYYLWDNVTADYATPVAISVGSGTYTISIYNAAISGSRPDNIMGEKITNAVLNIPQCDLFILNHGHNTVGSFSGSSQLFRRVPQLLETVESIKHTHSNCGVILIAQNPRRDDDDYAIVYNTILTTAGLINADVADVYSLFIRENKRPELFIDNVHPSTGLGADSGTQLYLNALTELHTSVIFKGSVSSFDSIASNHVLNGDFSAFSGITPDEWQETNALTTKDTVNDDGLNGYSVSIAPTVDGSQSRLRQTLGGDLFSSLRGGWVTLAARVYIPSATSTPTSGKIAINTNSNNSGSTQSASPINGFIWIAVSLKILSTDTFAQIFLYGDTGAGNGVAVFDRVVLVRGRLPRDII